MTNKRRKNAASSSGFMLIGIIVLIFCLVLMVKSHALMKKSRAFAKREVALEQQIDDAKKEKKKLEEKEAYMQTDEYIQEIARERLGLANPNEILFKPAEDE